MESFKSMEGYLHKKGGSKSKTSGSFSLLGRRNWTHRYFCLEGAELTYWKTTGGKRLSAPQGRVVLGEAELLDATIDGRDYFNVVMADDTDRGLRHVLEAGGVTDLAAIGVDFERVE